MLLYSGIHKGQRRWLADLSTRAGRTDFTEREEIEALTQEIIAFTELLRVHSDLEERFIHPTLGRIVPSCPRNIEAEHKIQHEDLDNLIMSLESIKKAKNDLETLPMSGHELYLALNRFISGYLHHIDFEEDHVQQILLNNCTAEDLFKIFKDMVSVQEPHVLMANVELMISGMSTPEIIRLLTQARAQMPEVGFKEITARASKFIEPQKWEMIKAQMGMQ